MRFTSTRDESLSVTGAQAIVSGLAPDGGLFVPQSFPQLPADDYLGEDYETLAARVLGLFLTDFTSSQLTDFVTVAYAEALPVRLRPLSGGGGLSLLELFHGRSGAFKDVALQLLPHLMTASLRLTGERRRAVVLTATSGDTGSAAMAGFAGVAGTEAIVFYPAAGISPIQRLQMTTQTAGNVYAIAVRGNFDDCQRAVKAIFQDDDFARQFSRDSFFTSANSINFGRLAPQIAYYFWAYAELARLGRVTPGEQVDFAVPTGNFGNILAGEYARRMGLPVGRLICATNRNDVLADALTTGLYDRRRAFHVTNSPSMDILVSSNFERLIYHLGGATLARQTQQSLRDNGFYQLPADILQQLRERFAVASIDDAATTATIRAVHAIHHCLIDPHTATAYKAWQDSPPDGHETVVVATASPYKFPETVEAATDQPLPPDEAPAAISQLTDKKITQTRTVELSELRDAIQEVLR